jgi:hypothetical protein
MGRPNKKTWEVEKHRPLSAPPERPVGGDAAERWPRGDSLKAERTVPTTAFRRRGAPQTRNSKLLYRSRRCPVEHNSVRYKDLHRDLWRGRPKPRNLHLSAQLEVVGNWRGDQTLVGGGELPGQGTDAASSGTCQRSTGRESDALKPTAPEGPSGNMVAARRVHAVGSRGEAWTLRTGMRKEEAHETGRLGVARGWTALLRCAGFTR